MNYPLSMLFLLFMTMPIEAKVIGVIGETFPVEEMSFLTLIETRLQAFQNQDALKAIEMNWVKAVEEHATRPTPVGLPRARSTEIHRYRPELTLKEAILDDKGRVLFPKGTQLNALHHLPHYQPHWLFIDGDDKAQVIWANEVLQQDNQAKLILTGGSVRDMEEALHHDIYFDQRGFISHQLNLNAVPTEVTRKGDVLLLKTIVLKEQNDAH